MEYLTLEKFNGHNFHTWKVKIQLHLMHKNLWGIVNGTKSQPTDPTQSSAWEQKKEKAKSIIGLSLSDSKLHLIDLDKSSFQIWEHLGKIFGEKAVKAKFSLKLQLFKLKMHEEASLSTHINELKSIIRKLAKIGNKIDDDDAKVILLNSLSSTYDNIIFTLSELSSRTFDDMI